MAIVTADRTCWKENTFFDISGSCSRFTSPFSWSPVVEAAMICTWNEMEWGEIKDVRHFNIVRFTVIN